MFSDSLDAVVYRVGLLASLRSRFKNGRTIGVMITASHNPPGDNGVKLVDPFVGHLFTECYSSLHCQGDMLEASWEKYATQLANALTDDDLAAQFTKIATEYKINLSAPARVIYARDTRASGARLVECLGDAFKATKVEYTDFRLATTPQLHYYTRCINTKGTQDAYGEPTEQGYYEKLAGAFKQVMEGVKPTGGVVGDCANGVGGPKLRELIRHLPSGLLDIKVVNEDVFKPDSLNYQVFDLLSLAFTN